MDDLIDVTDGCFPPGVSTMVISKDLPKGVFLLHPGETIRIEVNGKPLRLRNVQEEPMSFEVIGS